MFTRSASNGAPIQDFSVSRKQGALQYYEMKARSYLPNLDSNLVIALHALSLFFCIFINTTAYFWADMSLLLPLAVALHNFKQQNTGYSMSVHWYSNGHQFCQMLDNWSATEGVGQTEKSYLSLPIDFVSCLGLFEYSNNPALFTLMGSLCLFTNVNIRAYNYTIKLAVAVQ